MNAVASPRHTLLTIRQRGVAVFALILSVLLVTGAGFLIGRIAAENKFANNNAVTESLAMAKEALISYAVTYTDNYGHNSRGGVGRLPCPARHALGSPSLSCGRHAIGYLPGVWNRGGKRIDIDYREQFLNQNLWYAVSADFRYNPAYNALNPSAANEFLNVNGRSDIVAVIIHPGAMLADQDRSSDSPGIRDYLESENADGDASFEISSNNNDRIVTISRAEIMPLIERRVLGVVRDWLSEYYQEYGFFPFAARMGDPLAQCEDGLLFGSIAMSRGNCDSPAFGEFVSTTVPREREIAETWFGNNLWSQYIYYQAEESCTSALTDKVCPDIEASQHLRINGRPAKALLVSVGREIVSAYTGVMQDRLSHPEDRASYLDTSALVDASIHYDLQGLDVGSFANDQVMVVH